tara:strand:- start:180 stop:380 length:201 start_codon:yes stop_codon:yes gene_type:complete
MKENLGIDKLKFFEINCQNILSKQDNKLIEFYRIHDKNHKLHDLFDTWPEEVKIMMVDRYLERNII